MSRTCRIVIRIPRCLAEKNNDALAKFESIRADEKYYVIAGFFTNCYQGDDESIIFDICQDPDISAIADLGDWDVLWNESDY